MKRVGNKKLNPRPTVKKQVLKNKNVGSAFEGKITRMCNVYFEDHNDIGLAYRFPSGKACSQPIDILIDTQFGFYGIECKSIYTKTLSSGKIYFSKLGHINSDGLHQLQQQNIFLERSNRKGVIAIQFRDLKSIYLVPHVDLFNLVLNGAKYITVNWVQQNYPLFKNIDLQIYLEEL